jgi:hypothetical protein
MRGHAAAIADALQERGDVTLRRLVPGARDNGVAVIFSSDTPERALAARDALRGDGVAATLLHEPGVADLHVSPWWRPVEAAFERLGRTQPDVTRSLDILGRTVQIDVHPLFTEADVAAICAAVARF